MNDVELMPFRLWSGIWPIVVVHEGDSAEVKQARIVGRRHLCNEAIADRRLEINGALGVAVFIGERASEVAVVFCYLDIGGYPLAE